MFGFTYGFGFGGSGGGSVSAWLSLNGDLTTVGGVRYLANSEGDDVESTTGQGVYFNGVDQRIAYGDRSGSVGTVHTLAFTRDSDDSPTVCDGVNNIWVYNSSIYWYDSAVEYQVISGLPLYKTMIINFYDAYLDVYLDGLLYVSEPTSGDDCCCMCWQCLEINRRAMVTATSPYGILFAVTGRINIRIVDDGTPGNGIGRIATTLPYVTCWAVDENPS